MTISVQLSSPSGQIFCLVQLAVAIVIPIKRTRRRRERRDFENVNLLLKKHLKFIIQKFKKLENWFKNTT